MASQRAIEVANQIEYESWNTDSFGDHVCKPKRTLKDWPKLRDAVAEALDSFNTKLP